MTAKTRQRPRRRRATLAAVQVALVLLLVAAAPSAAWASILLEPPTPAYDADAPAVPRDLGAGTTPFVLYGRLGSPGEIDVYSLTAGAGDILTVTLQTPSWASAHDFRPAALVVPLKAIEGRPVQSLPMLIANSFEVVDPGLDPRLTVYDAASVSRYFVGGSTQVPVRKGGRYALVVFNTDGRQGPYRLAAGTEKKSATPGPVLLARLKLGLFGGGGPDMGVLLYCLGDALLIALVVFLALRWWKRKPAADAQGSR